MTTTSDNWPNTQGNVWMLLKTPEASRYLSDQYQSRIMGFEQRGDVTHAQTPPLVIGMLALGGGVAVERVLPEYYDWHVVNENFQRPSPYQTAQSQAIIAQSYLRNANTALKSFIGISEPSPGVTELGVLAGSKLYSRLLKRINTARTTAAAWDKDYVIDRITLSLLAGEADISETLADQHYADVAHTLRQDVTSASGQTSFPNIVISQSAGMQASGNSETILAEGRLDIQHPTLGFIVATPKYPYPMMSNMPGTHTPDASVIIDEMECLAVASVQSGKPWHCPSMEFAALRKRRIYVKFSTLSDLALGDGFHGFSIDGCSNDANITNVKTDGEVVVLTFNKAPAGDLQVLYAWGATSKKVNGQAANTGALHDSWSAKSLMLPETRLLRYALSGRIKVLTEQTGQVLIPSEE